MSSNAKVPIHIDLVGDDHVSLEDLKDLRYTQEAVERLEAVRAQKACRIASRLRKGAGLEHGDEVLDLTTMRVKKRKAS